MGFFISDVMAAAPASTSMQSESPFSLLLIVAVFVLFYFMLIRPQNKRLKEQRQLIASIKKGDEIITSGGILAKVLSLDEQYMKVSLAENVEITIQRTAVSTVLPKGTLKSL
jgi:preprotein translocase subunit YajC